MEKILIVICFAGCILSLLSALYYYFSFLGGVKPEKKNYLPLLGPAMMFIPALTDKEGNRAQRNFILSLLVFALSSGGLYVLNIMFPRQN